MSDERRTEIVRSAGEGGASTGGAPRSVRVVAGVVRRGDRILITQRPPTADHALQWEFPGGKIEPGETPEQALVREIDEELGVGARPLHVLAKHRHEYPSGLRVEIVFLEFELGSEQFQPSEAVHAARWARPGEIDPEELLAADRPFLAELARAANKDSAPER